ncbi:S-formylglutathione hydrolase [Pelagibacterium sp. H642]|uniref:S-formylglutathione hydrolase n=1 Tax=Pelagibacterium sp. H642 TaxID=1881069 RepID=UPI0028165D24|nr:S-formylglutathione hydrolase [Pelagibacterium sp. H642]WMT92625.1 S-formylglutathione hydrolase [Pelagibacterium sp. H642]
MNQIESHMAFAGVQSVWRHQSDVLGCEMNVAVFVPKHEQGEKLPVIYWLSGLTCTEQNFVTKAGAQRYAAEHGVIVVAPDTSPRGEEVADDPAYDLGQGAGFYINATQEPWARHFRMYDYVLTELPQLIETHFPANEKRSIMGHSMGGHGALIMALKNPGRFAAVSAFSPIVAPTQVPWGQKGFRSYLGSDEGSWRHWDATALLAEATERLPILIDQGEADDFLESQLKPWIFADEAKRLGHPLELRLHSGYDHSYYFIATLIGDHIAWHVQALKN